MARYAGSHYVGNFVCWKSICALFLVYSLVGLAAASEEVQVTVSESTSGPECPGTGAERQLLKSIRSCTDKKGGAVKVGTDIVGFMLIASATFYIGFRNVTYKGPSNNERYFNGFREENMIGFFVNLFASVAYFARILGNSSCTMGFEMLTQIRYADYMTTCPLLVLDLLWNLEAPYKCTCAGLILVTIFTGVAACTSRAPESYLWFAYGDVIFIIAYAILVVIVRERMQFFVSRAKTNSALKAMYYVKFACCCFFCIWVWYPLLYVVSPYCLNLISMEVNDMLHMFLDVCAKSVYGIVLMWFRWNYDKTLLRNLDEQEFLAFGAKADKAISDIAASEEAVSEQENLKLAPVAAPPSPFKFASSESNGEGAFAFSSRGDESQRRSPELVRNAKGVTQPFTASSFSQSNRIQGEIGTERERCSQEDGRRSPLGTGSRLMFPSNRNQSPQGSPFRRRPSAPSIPPMNRSRQEDHPRGMDQWQSELYAYLEDCGVAGPAATLAKLEQAGVTEELLSTCITDQDLRDVGLDVATRRAILSRYTPGGAGGASQLSTSYVSLNGANREANGWNARALS